MRCGFSWQTSVDFAVSAVALCCLRCLYLRPGLPVYPSVSVAVSVAVVFTAVSVFWGFLNTFRATKVKASQCVCFCNQVSDQLILLSATKCSELL